jgi:hypothetical protein
MEASMTELLPLLPAAGCQAGRCDRVPCFQARLEAYAGRRPVARHAELCAEHLGDAVHALAAWARDQGLEGKVTVLAVDQLGSGQCGGQSGSSDGIPCGFAFGTILVNQ